MPRSDTASETALVQAQRQLDKAKQHTRHLQGQLEAHKATLDAHRNGATIDLEATRARIEELENELAEHRREALPGLTTAVSQAKAQQVIDRVSSNSTSLLSDHDARALAAAQAGNLRRSLQGAKQRLADNDATVTELIDTLQGDPGIQDNEHVAFPSPGHVTIHGMTYSTTGPDDLHFLAQRALQHTWPN